MSGPRSVRSPRCSPRAMRAAGARSSCRETWTQVQYWACQPARRSRGQRRPGTARPDRPIGLQSCPHDRSGPACCLCPRLRERHVHRPSRRDPLGRLREHQLEPGLLQALRHLRRHLPEEHARPPQRRDHRGGELHPLRPLRALLPRPRDRDDPGRGRGPRGEGRSEPA